MNFDEIVVKESPGLCRCCLSEGCYKDLGTEYTWMNENEVYADMLLECFDISISQHTDGPNGSNRLICEVCITRLRDACNFKKQVLDSEKKFVDMLARGEFQPKVIMYQAAPLKTEQLMEEPAAEDVEYLEDMDYEDDLPLNQVGQLEASVSDLASTVKVKGKRGRPKKTTSPVKTEKKPKISKMDAKPQSSKAVAKGRMKREESKNYLERLSTMRKNIKLVLHYGNVTPFLWYTKGYRCFYCQKPAKDCDSLKEHTKKHQKVDLESFIPQRIITKDIPVKIDISDLECRVCPEKLTSLTDLTEHIRRVHGEEYDSSIEMCIFPFILTKAAMSCCICASVFDNITCLVTHMYKEHTAHKYLCTTCGLSFSDKVRLARHSKKSHRGHICTLCDKYFVGFHRLQKHKERMHGLAKVHECNLCTATFENDYQVKVHLGKVHNVEKYRIKCEFCPKVSTTKGAMLLHVQSMHSNAKYECDLCSYKCGIKWMIKLHKRKHFGEKDYVCTICLRKFGRSSNLRAHIKVHTGNAGRVCRWCKQGFTDQETLTKHEAETHYHEESNDI